MAIFHRFRRIGTRKGSKKIPFIAGMAVAVMSIAGAALFTVHRAGAATCKDNNIIHCGFSDAGDFITKVRANNDDNGHSDLQAIYDFYHLTSADYQNFADHAVAGTVYSDGTIKVNGVTVGTDGKSIGRDLGSQGNNPFTQNINGVDYYGNVMSEVFESGTTQASVLVLFDGQGQEQFAVMPSCGNPVPVTPVPSSASCKMLNKTPVEGQANTYTFTADANHEGLASITKFVYDFGDGSDTVTQTSGDTPVTHTYTKSGTFTAKVTVFASVPGNDNLQLPVVVECTKEVTVTPAPTPSFACVLLTPAVVDQNKMVFSFTVKTQAGGGDIFTSADFDFGDGTTQNGVQPNNDGITATATHTYTETKTYTVKATVHSQNSPQGVTADACMTSVSPTTPPPPPPPPTPPAPKPKPPVPPVLPNTGAGNVITLFGLAIVGGFLGYRQVLLRKGKSGS